MIGSFFAWIRRRTAESVLAGFADAVAEIDPDAGEPVVLDDLRRRLALPAPEPEAANGRRRQKVEA